MYIIVPTGSSSSEWWKLVTYWHGRRQEQAIAAVGVSKSKRGVVAPATAPARLQASTTKVSDHMYNITKLSCGETYFCKNMVVVTI